MAEFDRKALVEAGRDWEVRKQDSPVIKMSNRVMDTFGVLGALVQKGEEQVVLGVNFQVSESGTHSCLLGEITLEELEQGVIEARGVDWKIEFVGKASDEQHKVKKWSYWG